MRKLFTTAALLIGIREGRAQQAPRIGDSSPAAVQGQVLAPGNASIGGLTVQLTRVYAPSGGFQPFSLNATTGSDGQYRFGLLPPGRYTVCVRPKTTYVEHCNWHEPKPLDLAAGQTASVPPIQLEAGYQVQVQIIDTAGLIEKNEGKSAISNLTVGVTTPNQVFLPAHGYPLLNAQKNFEIMVPNSTSFVARVHSSFFKLTDENGAPVDKDRGASVPGQPPSQPSQTGASLSPVIVRPLIFRVVGTN